MQNKRLHGLHNNEVCDLLIRSGKDNCNDWIVTTAFYSALHFVHHHIFPLQRFQRIYRSFEIYYTVQYPDHEVSKHTVTRNLVKKYISEISSKYNWLFKECYNARYKTYLVDHRIAKTAKEYLEDIKIRTNK